MHVNVKPLRGWAQRYLRYSAVLACLSCCLFGLSCLKYAIEMSLWKADIKRLFHRDIRSAEWADGGQSWDKRPGCCTLTLGLGHLSFAPASTRAAPFDTHRRERVATLSGGNHFTHTNSDCRERVRDVSVKVGVHVNQVLYSSSSACSLTIFPNAEQMLEMVQNKNLKRLNRKSCAQQWHLI